jgi:DNA polymerase-3 subunit delta'
MPTLPGGPAPSLDVAPSDPVARRLAALSEPRHFLLRRGANQRGDALSAEIRVDEVRRLVNFLHLSAADGGRRTVIVDAADELNTEASNAILKLLEEPPSGVTFLLVSHKPLSLLATIRSRCRELRLQALSGGDLSAALSAAGSAAGAAGPLGELADGSVGEAIRIAGLDGLDTYSRLVRLMSDAPGINRSAAVALADTAAGRTRPEETDMTFALVARLVARLARAGAAGAAPPEAATGEAAMLARLSPGAGAARKWADTGQRLAGRIAHGRAVNLDPASLLLDTLLKLNETAGEVLRR